MGQATNWTPLLTQIHRKHVCTYNIFLKVGGYRWFISVFLKNLLKLTLLLLHANCKFLIKAVPQKFNESHAQMCSINRLTSFWLEIPTLLCLWALDKVIYKAMGPAVHTASAFDEPLDKSILATTKAEIIHINIGQACSVSLYLCVISGHNRMSQCVQRDWS